jgi:tetratricopeptide (TPR) repeat protein
LTQLARKASDLLGELKRRQVIKVVVVYAIVGAGVAQAADVFLGNLAPPWVLNASLLLLLLLGFPIAIVLAWAYEAIDRAFALDDELPEAYVARAFWRFNFRYDWEGAEKDFGRAIDINPSSADAYQWRGLMHLLCRRNEKAIADARQSVALDPLSFQTRSQLGQNLIWGGEPDAARPIVEEILQEDPTNTIAHWSLGILARKTDLNASLAHYEDALRYMDVPLAHASRCLTLRALGRVAEADEVIARLEARRGTECVSPFALAITYFGKNDRDRGFAYLNQGVDDHDFLSLYMRIQFHGVADDPRYRALVQRVWPEDFPLVR